MKRLLLIPLLLIFACKEKIVFYGDPAPFEFGQCGDDYIVGYGPNNTPITRRRCAWDNRYWACEAGLKSQTAIWTCMIAYTDDHEVLIHKRRER